ncbi:dienelactone hydrolase [Obelidium mucronatum]|nr:dienelactone hydrolase [Obelidium mucronatum]
MASIACCSGSIASKSTSALVGREETIAGHACYVSYPKKPIGALSTVVIAADIFGYKLINSRLIADKFASAGYLAVIPDLFKGSELPANIMSTISDSKASIFQKIYAFGQLLWYMPGFLWKNSFSKGVSILETVILELKEKRNVKKVAVQGYCWGGSLAVKLAQHPNTIDVACAAHPSFLQIPADIEKIQKPIFFVLPSKDHSIKEQHKNIIESVLAGKDKSSENGFLHQVEWFEGAQHGFAVRGDDSDPVVAAMAQTALNNAISFFGDVLNWK